MNLVGYDAAYNAVMIVTVYSIYPEGSRTWRMMLKAANEFLPWWNKPDGPALTVIHDGEKAASSAIKEHTLPNVHSFMDCRHMANNLLANVPRKGRSYRYRRSTIAGMQNCEGQGCTDSNRSLFLCTPVAPHTLHPPAVIRKNDQPPRSCITRHFTHILHENVTTPSLIWPGECPQVRGTWTSFPRPSSSRRIRS